MREKGLDNLIGTHHEEVKIEAGAAGCQSEPSGINVVRSFFKWYDLNAFFPPEGVEADREDRLPTSATEAGNNYPGD
jgi:hypothetical protein